MKVELLEEGTIDISRLTTDVMDIRNKWPDDNQFCITNVKGDNNLFDGAMTCMNSTDYTKLNPYFYDTYLEELVEKYPDYYRWRMLCMPIKKTYSIHRDSLEGGMYNQRIHIPVITNPDSFLVFYEHPMVDSGTQQIEYHHLKAGNVYLVDTTNYHTAVNYNFDSERIHIVAERFIPNE